MKSSTSNDVIKIFLTCALQVICSAARSQHPITNQRLYDTLPYQQEYHSKKIQLFASEPMEKDAIIFAGNSITEGADWKALTGYSNILNRGISGDVTYGLLQRIDEIIARRPSRLFIKIGINDIAKDIPDAVIADNCRKIILKVRQGSPSTKIYLQSILPVNPMYKGFPQHYDKTEHILGTNILLKKIADSCNITFIDLYPYFCDRNGMLNAEYTYDGLHLNKKGYQQWVAVLKQKGVL
ncbi:MAG: GDSL-type esterase/lipase family protein [Cytophagaceae bacterium]|nr:GDSL-type esterase/lipase family protein [Cytophagaceae bacterium]MDW8456927.1 GDSL-type esterase/lipase family protein [Cytophagaceae bacterium]